MVRVDGPTVTGMRCRCYRELPFRIFPPPLGRVRVGAPVSQAVSRTLPSIIVAFEADLLDPAAGSDQPADVLVGEGHRPVTREPRKRDPCRSFVRRPG